MDTPRQRWRFASMDRILTQAPMAALIAQHGRERVKTAVRALQDAWRQSGEVPDAANDPAAYPDLVAQRLHQRDYHGVFNLTGTMIHTNLGRAPLSRAMLVELADLVSEPFNLEFDLHTGRRGDRERTVTERLCTLTGAPAACIVNNNAAALVLVLNTLALGREVPVSRGELIEIGGSFRLPELMRRSGCELVEVGTTNRTRSEDYAAAIGPETALLLKVHPSNYHIEGFTEAASLAALAEVAQSQQLPLVEDLGSGSLIDLTRWGLPAEPTPRQSLQAGANLVTFSGDKLLGSVQAGIIVGDAELVAALNKNPLKRALRLDKIALALLNATLKLYEEPDRLARELPLLRRLTTPLDELRRRAQTLRERLQAHLPDVRCEVRDARCQLGSGALPSARIDSVALVLEGGSPAKLAARLRSLPQPVIGRVHDDALWLDMRGAEQLDALLASLEALSA